MAMYETWATPEEGFDPDDNSAVLAFYGKDNLEHRAALDPRGQRAPPLEERIEAALKDFERLIGRPPNEHEKKRMVDTQIKCSGWLEGLKIDLAGKTEVPIAFFNRLVEEQEDMILFVARDRVQFDAEWMEKVMKREDEIQKLTEELEKCKAESAGGGDPKAADTTEVDNLKKEKSDLEAQLEKLQADNLSLRQEIEQSKSRAPALSLGNQFAAIAEEATRIRELEDESKSLQEELDALKEDTKDCDSAKTDLAKLKEGTQTRETELKDLEAKTQGLQEKLDKVKQSTKDCGTVKTDNSKLKKRIQSLEAEVNDLRSRISASAQAATEEDKAKLEGLNKEINDLKSQLETTESTLAEKKRKLQEANGYKATALDQEKKIQDLEDQLKKKVEEKDQEIDTLKSKIKAAESTLAEKTRQLAEANDCAEKDKEIGNLQSQVNSAEAALVEKKKELEDASDQKDQEIHELLAQIEDLDSALADVKRDAEQAEAQKGSEVELEKKIQELENKLKACHDRNDNLGAEEQALRQYQQQLLEMTSNLEHQLEEGKTKKAAEAEKEEDKKEEDEETLTLTEVAAKREKLMTQVRRDAAERDADVKKQIEEKNKEISELQDKLDSCQAKRKVADAEIEKLKKELQELKDKELKDLKKKLDDCESNGKHLENIIEQQKDQVRELQGKKRIDEMDRARDRAREDANNRLDSLLQMEDLMNWMVLRTNELMEGQEEALMETDRREMKEIELQAKVERLQAMIAELQQEQEEKEELGESNDEDEKARVATEKNAEITIRALRETIEDLRADKKQTETNYDALVKQHQISIPWPRSFLHDGNPPRACSPTPPSPRLEPENFQGKTKTPIQIHQKQHEILRDVREKIESTLTRMDGFKVMADRHMLDCHAEITTLGGKARIPGSLGSMGKEGNISMPPGPGDTGSGQHNNNPGSRGQGKVGGWA